MKKSIFSLMTLIMLTFLFVNLNSCKNDDETSKSNTAPGTPTNPSPGIGTGSVSAVSLSWTCSDPDGDALTYDIYFGTAANPPLIKSANPGSTYIPTGVTANTKYYWKIVARDKSTSTAGDIWYFTTASALANPIIFNPNLAYGSFTDPRDGRTYKTIKIGTQTWMAENLAYKYKISCWWYDNDSITNKIYGRLYDNGVARSVAPPGWHLPSKTEWETLINYLGGIDIAGGKLKEEGLSHWSSPNTGATNSSGFSALPAGACTSSGVSSYKGTSAGFWTSTDHTNGPYLAKTAYNYTNISVMSNDAYSGRSVRCIKD